MEPREAVSAATNILESICKYYIADRGLNRGTLSWACIQSTRLPCSCWRAGTGSHRRSHDGAALHSRPNEIEEASMGVHDDPFAVLISKGFEVKYVSHARAILEQDFSEQIDELVKALSDLELPISEIIGGGGGETHFTQRLRRSLSASKWPKHNFVIKKIVDKVEKESISHEIDHVRETENGVIALEIEWNNKDPFFDRDLENFKRLHAEGAISVGILVTRGTSLQSRLLEFVRRFVDERGIANFDQLKGHGYNPTGPQRNAVDKQTGRKKDALSFAEAWSNNFVKSKYGAATTHWSKLRDRIDRGVGNPCPLVLIGLPAEMVRFDAAPIVEIDDSAVNQP